MLACRFYTLSKPVIPGIVKSVKTLACKVNHFMPTCMLILQTLTIE